MDITPPATIVSLQVGLPTTLTVEDSASSLKSWTTGSFKYPQLGQVWLGTLNLVGDGQADLMRHGGPDKAVCVYPSQHYPVWRRELKRLDFSHGAFGENFTVDGLSERDVCIGDIWTIGSATIQVSQPRQPCWQLSRRWGIKGLALRVQESGRTGWYCRVLVEGFVASGLPLILKERLHADWSIESANQVMHRNKLDLKAADHLANIPALSGNWQTTLRRRVEQRVYPDERQRLHGDA